MNESIVKLEVHFVFSFLWIQRSNGFLWLIKRFLFVSDTSTERVPFFPSVRQHSAKAHQSPIKIPHTVEYFVYLFYFVSIILYADHWKKNLTFRYRYLYTKSRIRIKFIYSKGVKLESEFLKKLERNLWLLLYKVEKLM